MRYERLVPFGAGSLLEGPIHLIEPGGLKNHLTNRDGNPGNVVTRVPWVHTPQGH